MRAAQRLDSLPVALAIFAGTAGALQAFVNGRLAIGLGSAEAAGTAVNLVGLAALVLFAGATGAAARALAQLRAGARPRAWHVLINVTGAVVVIGMAKAAPQLGVALFTVAVVCGQTSGSLMIDRLGIGPAGRERLTAPRLLGMALTLVAVVNGAFASGGDPQLGLLALSVCVGVSIALQQASFGHLSRVTGEPLAAATIAFAVASAATVTAWLALTGGAVPNGWSAPPLAWTCGLIGALAVVIMARVVTTLGVLRLALALVAGQSGGSLVLDLIAPVAGQAVTLRTVVSVALAFVAVAVSGLARETLAPRRRRACA